MTINFWFWVFLIMFTRFFIYPVAVEEFRMMLHKRAVKRLEKELTHHE